MYQLKRGRGVRAVILTCGLIAFGCGEEADNNFAQMSLENEQYEHKLSELEKQVGTLSQTSDYHSDDFKLTHNTVLQCQDYLEKLYLNINSTHENHLPDWQQMFDVLTNSEALSDPEFKIGFPAMTNNFYRHSVSIWENSNKIEDASLKLDKVETETSSNSVALRDVNAHLSTIDSTVETLNATLSTKFQAIDKVLEAYNGRIRASEDRMAALETSFRDVERRVNNFESRIYALEKILTQYNIPGMSRRLGEAEAMISSHGDKITAAETDIGLLKSSVGTLQDDLNATNQELGRATDELRQLILSYHP